MAELVDRRSAAALPREAAETDVAGPEQSDPAGLTLEQLTSQTWLLIQNLADALPDDVTRFARQSLADDEPAQALSALVFACIQLGTSLSTVEYAVLSECLLSVGGDVSLLDHVTVNDVERPVLFEFVELLRSADDVSRVGAVAGLAGGPDADTEEAFVAVARAVYLVEARDEAAVLELVSACYGGQDGLGRAGEPIVEVYATGVELPPLHRAVQFAGELVIAASAPPDSTFADVFDGEPDAEGLPQHVTRVFEEEADQLITYLLSGTPMLVADAQGEDVLDPSRGQSVPLHLRTDGTWVWSDASAYYLREHLIGPPPVFQAYLRAAPETAARVSDVTLHHAVTWLQSS